MSTTYVSFTPAERKQARMTDLAEFLRRQRYDLKREGRGSVWMNGGEKISIQANLWYNQYTREGGDAINFARRFFDCPDYPSAVRLLLGADVGVAVINPQKQEKKKEQKPFTLPPANSDMHRIYAYLMKQRGIERDVIHAFTHGQHGTARWATKREIGEMYLHVPFEPEQWRLGQNLPTEQGIVVGCEGRNDTVALVDTGDVHALMVGAAGVGKTAYWLYPCIEYACATGMSFLTTDTKGVRPDRVQ